MHITKIQASFDEYKVELSWSELKAIETAMAENHSGVVADETYARLKFYIERVPGPGEEKGASETLEQTKVKDELAVSKENPASRVKPDVELHNEEPSPERDIEITDIPELP